MIQMNEWIDYIHKDGWNYLILKKNTPKMKEMPENLVVRKPLSYFVTGFLLTKNLIKPGVSNVMLQIKHLKHLTRMPWNEYLNQSP